MVWILRSLGIVLLGMAFLGGLYPALIVALGKALFSYQARGSLVFFDNQERGSLLIAQSFVGESYLLPRPSAAEYNAAASAGSNLSPTSQKLRSLIEARIASYRLFNKVPPGVLVPIDAVTSSGSGLDPQISLQNALLQATRIATVRDLSERQIRNIIIDHSSRTLFDQFTQRCVNVLECNLAIEQFHRYVRYGLHEERDE